MKKIISVALCLLMAFSVLTACKDEQTAGNDLENAKAYLVNMYQTGSKDEPMVLLMDKDVLSVVTIDGVKYDVAWTVTVTEGASDAIKVVESSVPNHVKIDVPDLPETDILFTATATVKDAEGNTQAANFKYKVSGLASGPSVQEIIDIAYGLAQGASTDVAYTLTGTVISIDTPYSSQYKNVTVTMEIEGFEDKPIQCYRLTGEGADVVAVGDTITVTGIITNYKGTVQYDAGANINALVKGEGNGEVSEVPGEESDVSGEVSEVPDEESQVPGGDVSETPTPVEKTPAQIVDEAYGLADGESLSYSATLTGVVVSVDDAYDEEFGNITVTIKIEGKDDKPIKCYRLTGTDADRIAKGDTITVTGVIKNYFGTVEFDFGCVLENRVAGGGTPPSVLTDPAQIMNAAYELEKGASMEYDVTLKGVVTKVTAPYDPSYKNISVVIDVEGSDKELLLYRLKGDEASLLVKGDTITVTGRIINYNGTIEMEAGCTIRSRVSGGGTVQTAPSDPKEIVKAAYELEPGDALPYKATLTGTIISIDTEYSEQYGNITVTIEIEGCEDKPIKCYRMKGEGAAALKVGDVITVSGTIKNYQHSSGECEVEFDSGCTFVK